MPTFPRNLLAEHETLIFDKKPHWIALAPATLWALLIVVATFFLLWVLDRELDDVDWAPWVILLVAFVALCIFSIGPFLQWIYTNFVLTSDR